jgi:hypothetical protein
MNKHHLKRTEASGLGRDAISLPVGHWYRGRPRRSLRQHEPWAFGELLMGQKIWWYNHTVKKFYRCCTTSDQIRDRVGQWEASLPMKEELWLRDTNLFKLAWEIQTSQDIYTTMCPSYNLKHYNQSDRCFQYNQESTGSPSSSRSKRPVY